MTGPHRLCGSARTVQMLVYPVCASIDHSGTSRLNLFNDPCRVVPLCWPSVDSMVLTGTVLRRLPLSNAMIYLLLDWLLGPDAADVLRPDPF